jgi:hypothetical protein
MARNGASGEGDDFAFLKEAVGSLFVPGLKLPFLLAIALHAGTTLLIVISLPTRQDPGHGPYLAAFATFVVVHAVLALAILRLLNASPRPAWKPDWSAGTYGLIVLGSVAVGLFADWVVPPTAILSALANEIVSTAIIVPLAPWFVAVAVECPLAWRPGPWFARLRAWLPALLLWNFLILVPADAAYRIGFGGWMEQGGTENWLFYPLDGFITAARTFLALALASVAYRRVARV